MRLVYTEGPKKGEEVKIGDTAQTFRGETVTVEFFRPPHKAASAGKVSVSFPGSEWQQEFYVSVIGAEWVEREDRA